MRIIKAYTVVRGILKYTRLCYEKQLALFLMLGMCSPLVARDWTVYLYLQAHDSYAEALTVVAQLEDALRSDTTGRIHLAIDIQAGTHAHRILFKQGKKYMLPAEPQ